MTQFVQHDHEDFDRVDDGRVPQQPGRNEERGQDEEGF